MSEVMQKPRLIQPDELAPAVKLTDRLMKELNNILLGNEKLHRLVLIGIVSRGHILLEGLPGLGKTALVKALGDLMSLEFNRVQFTPDLMPTDILGANILQENEHGHREMVFEKGPIFTNILLADEINRASPKTQSALLEAMQEFSVTLLGQTRSLPLPFFVMASQNPIELEGTYPIPEAQLDRFLFKLNVGSASEEVLTSIITTRRRGIPPKPDWKMNLSDLELIFETMEKIFLPKTAARYIARLVSATNPDGTEIPDEVRQYISYGASPRAAIALSEAARASALIDGRPTVSFKDIRAVLPAVLNHRLILNYKARIDNVDVYNVIEKVVASVNTADLNLPSQISLS